MTVLHTNTMKFVCTVSVLCVYTSHAKIYVEDILHDMVLLTVVCMHSQCLVCLPLACEEIRRRHTTWHGIVNCSVQGLEPSSARHSLTDLKSTPTSLPNLHELISTTSTVDLNPPPIKCCCLEYVHSLTSLTSHPLVRVWRHSPVIHWLEFDVTPPVIHLLVDVGNHCLAVFYTACV
jgi:hypothetical protein